MGIRPQAAANTRGWADFIKSDAAERGKQQLAARSVRTQFGTNPNAIRREFQWRPLPDPGEAARKADIRGIEYEPINIRIVRQPDGSLFFRYMSAWVKVGESKRFVVSNAHNGNREEYPCLLYYKLCVTPARDGVRSMYEASDSYVCEVELLEDFHVVEEMNGEYKNVKWHRCEGPGAGGRTRCEHCLGGIPTVFGKRVHWSLFPPQRKALERELDRLNERCTSCNRGAISIYGWHCAGCNSSFGDRKAAETDPSYELSDELDAYLRESPLTCSNCAHHGMAVPDFECLHQVGVGRNKQWQAGCSTPTMLDPAESVLALRTDLNGKNSVYSIVEARPLDTVELPTATGFELCPPFTLAGLFDTSSIADQARSIGIAPENSPIPFEKLQADLDAATGAVAEAGTDESDANSAPWDDAT